MPRHFAATLVSSGDDVQAGLDGEHHARFEQARFAVDAVVADVVHVQAEPVPGLVPVEAPVAAVGDVLLQRALEQARARSRPSVSVSHRGVVPGFVRRRPGCACASAAACAAPTRSCSARCSLREAPVDREGAGDVGGVAAVLGAGVDQHQVAVARAARCWRGNAARRRWRRRRRCCRRPARRRACGTRARARPAARIRARPARAARIAAWCAATLMSAARCISLISSLDLNRRSSSSRWPEFEELVRRLRAHAHLRAHAVEPADQLEVELGVAAEVVVDARAAFEQAGQDFVEVGDRVRIVHAERRRPRLPGRRAGRPSLRARGRARGRTGSSRHARGRAPAPAPLRVRESR